MINNCSFYPLNLESILDIKAQLTNIEETSRYTSIKNISNFRQICLITKYFLFLCYVICLEIFSNSKESFHKNN